MREYSSDMEQIERVLRGISEPIKCSTFIDNNELQDSSNKNWLEQDETRDYTTFGEMKKIENL